MSPISAVAADLEAHAGQIADELVDTIVRQFKKEVPKEEVLQAKQMYSQFLFFLGESILSGEEAIHNELIEWSRKNGETQASRRLPISEVLDRYPVTRSVFTDYLTELSCRHGLSAHELISVVKQFDFLLDVSISETVLAFERQSEEIILASRQRINELSAPVVSLQEGVAVIPLIGLIDTDRAELLIEQTIPKITRLDLTVLIADFSGLLTIDRTAAKHLTEIYRMLRMLGINVIATGIRPEIAQAIVHAGTSLSSLKSFASVRQALEQLNSSQ